MILLKNLSLLQIKTEEKKCHTVVVVVAALLLSQLLPPKGSLTVLLLDGMSLVKRLFAEVLMSENGSELLNGS